MDKSIFKCIVENDESVSDYEAAIYIGSTRLSSIHISRGAFAFIPHYEKELLKSKENISFLVTSSLLAFVRIKDKESNLSVIIGPAMIGKHSPDMVNKVAEATGLDPKKDDKFIKALGLLKRTVPHTFYSNVYNLYVFINHEMPEETMLNKEMEATNTLLMDSYQKSIEAMDNEAMEGANYCKYYEDMLVYYIQNGQPDHFFDVVPEVYHERKILLSLDELRAYKDRAISLVSVISREAIEGGLDPDSSYILNDMYIQKIEHEDKKDGVDVLVHTMLVDYCTRIGQSNVKKTANPTINRAIDYVNEHLREKLNTGNVSKALHISSNYLSSRFKAETNMNFTYYISMMKIEEAKRLLARTDKPLSDISNYLAFSSQSYFQNVFKEIAGLTPLEYRNQNK
ncbi:MAG: AraC family transcriptional regulator [Bacilli bacterium]|jgi:AraC-like DNA-binding protein|nr:AraC family transcriptional regulator [Bacilli bacterium]